MVAVPSKCFSSFKANFPIDGKVFSSIEYHELREMGFNVGESKQVAAVISDYFFGSYQSPPYETYHLYSPPGPDWPQMQSATGNMEFQRTLVEERPIEVATTAVLEALIGIDQVNFYFEAQFLLVMSWRDARINTKWHTSLQTRHMQEWFKKAYEAQDDGDSSALLRWRVNVGELVESRIAHLVLMLVVVANAAAIAQSGDVMSRASSSPFDRANQIGKR